MPRNRRIPPASGIGPVQTNSDGRRSTRRGVAHRHQGGAREMGVPLLDGLHSLKRTVVCFRAGKRCPVLARTPCRE